MSLKASCIFHLKIFSNTFSWPILPIKMEKLQIFEEIDGLTLSSFLTSFFYSLKRLFLFVPFPSLAGANNRNVIITHQFLVAPVQANRDFFLTYWLYISTISTFLYIRASLRASIKPGTRNMPEHPGT